MQKKLLLSFLIVGFSMSGHAQEESDPLFYKLSVSPFKFTAGDFGIQYETRLAKYLAIDLGVGVTYPYELVDDIWNRFSGSFNPRPGASGQVILRYYPFHADTRKGFAIEGMFRFQRFHGKATGVSFQYESALQSKWLATDLRHITMNFSYQVVSSGNWSFRPYLGFGSLDRTQYYTEEVSTGVIDQSSNAGRVVVEHQRKKHVTLYPTAKFGIEIGILKYNQ